MYRLVIFLIFFLVGCQQSVGNVSKNEISKNDINLDAVQKELIIKDDLPFKMSNLVNEWFNKHVKVNGFEGKATIIIESYNEKISDIQDGKRIDINIKISLLINKDNFSKLNNYKFELNEFGSITGNFSLFEVDQMIENTQLSLVNRFSKLLNLKI